jgi:hypothetical protein
LIFDGLRQILEVERGNYRAAQVEISRRMQPLSEADAAIRAAARIPRSQDRN